MFEIAGKRQPKRAFQIETRSGSIPFVMSRWTEALRKFAAVTLTVEPRVPAGRKPLVPEAEVDESDVLAVELVSVTDDEPLSQVYWIKYQAADGDISERRVKFTKVQKNAEGRLYLNAFCFERLAPRTFRMDRLLEVVDLHTGEILQENDEIEDRILELYGEIGPTPREQARKVLKTHKNELTVLMYLALVDDHLDERECEIVEHFILDSCFDEDMPLELIEDVLYRFYPDRQDFEDALHSLAGKAQRGQINKKFLRYAAQLVNADEKLTPEEAELYQVLAQELALH